MSKENLNQFIQKVIDSEGLQARIGDEIDADSLIALGAECGCEFTAEELQDSAELSDEELDTVAGGAGNSYLSLSPPARRKSQRRFRANSGSFTARIVITEQDEGANIVEGSTGGGSRTSLTGEKLPVI